MTKSFPRTLRRAAADDALVQLLRDSPWEKAMNESPPSEEAPSFHVPDRLAHVETRRGR